MKLFILIFLIGTCLFAQEKWVEKNGFVSFFSSAPLEDIQAKSSSVVSILDLEKNELQVMMKIRSFDFPNKLMQEHFNENYLESETYPTAKLIAPVTFDLLSLKENDEKRVNLLAKLTIHGVEKEYVIPLDFKKLERSFVGETKFNVRVADHNIKIPKIVIKKIAEVVEVTAKLKWEAQN